jgi:hypothetical protein
MGDKDGELAVEVKTVADTGPKDRRGADPAAPGGAARPRRRRGGPMRCQASGDGPP